ncbi:hypothetical protein IQ270_01380 [Microcoleus sp. LEGE 07076]|uniref:hypothetical protein n=1 Tax=Microcoleus sp. LEGE 07076 TaxID=915322 RepID=UPI00187ED350|nr:hypothetical protein [Microcoleus sp. LEGE 07076]MBE9183410.1 hypothetical protein [Microcoleus sp. LEGE 07076]
MSTQLVMSNNSSTLSRPQVTASNPEMASPSTRSTSLARKLDSAKCPYQADQQVKFLHLQAEIDSLLLQVQTLTQQRSIAALSAPEPISGSNSN